MSRISADSFVTSFNKRVFSVLLERVKEMRSVSPMDISEAFTADEMSSITSILSSRPRENNPKRAIQEYIDILLEEKEKISPEKQHQPVMKKCWNISKIEGKKKVGGQKYEYITATG